MKGLAVHLLRDIERYIRNKDTTAARFGRDVVRDPRFVFDLRNGREPRPSTEARVRQFLELGR
ncbi:MAG: hypothetical protein LC656_09370 [Sphingomonadales bacterium]|nr:hypothetical protein [Sphingomonadales bacterium]